MEPSDSREGFRFCQTKRIQNENILNGGYER